MTTAFDLNSAITRWRSDLAQAPAFHGEDLEEMEAHLRDGILALQTRGLTEEEAFFVAARRLGQPAALAQEFGKVNPAAVRGDRALWMLAGMVLLLLGWDLGGVAASTLTLLGSLAGSEGLSLGCLSRNDSDQVLGLAR